MLRVKVTLHEYVWASPSAGTGHKAEMYPSCIDSWSCMIILTSLHLAIVTAV
jgi:signal transduction histidine kinase